ncbi:MAG: hypothetical protein JNK24_05810 [Alphaproteobacteria bacterium]|nr:hypothetical protein [Alphaproteobacteria bacterium]
MKKSMVIFLLLMAMQVSILTGAMACVPKIKTFEEYEAFFQNDNFYLGEVIDDKDQGSVRVKILIPGGPERDKKAGDILTFDLRPALTCAHLPLGQGEKWLLDGDTFSSSFSEKLEQEDLKDGMDLNVIKKNVFARLKKTFSFSRWH